MKLSHLLSLSLTAVGSAAAARVLQRRHQWEAANDRVALCVDYDDAWSAAVRAGLPFDDMLGRLAEHGATHVSLPERSLDRLRESGRLVPRAPTTPLSDPPAVGHWNYLHGAASLVAELADELSARLAYTQARVVDDTTLAFAGDLQTLGEIGLGFDRTVAAQVVGHGLGIVPRPVSYAWPEPALLTRTLAQAAVHGRIVAFAGDMILGHEMHLAETLVELRRHDLTLAYFTHSRHQKGDWFLAKQHSPHVVLAHQFSPAEMRVLDSHAACHNWVHLAREHGVRLCYVNLFRELHATGPLEGLHYLAHLRRALEDAGYHVHADVEPPTPIPTPQPSDIALSGLATARLAVSAAERWLDLPGAVATPFAIAAAGGAAALPYLEAASLKSRQISHAHEGDRSQDHAHDHSHNHHGDHSHNHADGTDGQLSFTTSYAPKVLALATAALAPVAGLSPTPTSRAPAAESSIATALISEIAGAATLAALTSGEEYQLRIEDYRGFNLDWLLPLAAAASRMPERRSRIAAVATLAGLWVVAYTRQLDPLAHIDPDHSEGHTHHISAAQRFIGDVRMALGPRPARKWAGLGPLGHAAAVAFAQRGYRDLSVIADLIGSVGDVLALAAFRRSERGLSTTAQTWLPSYVAGAALGLLILLLVPAESGS